MKLINIGFGNSINFSKLVSAIGSDSAPAKRLIGKAKEDNKLIDATAGRKCRTIFIMDSGHIVTSYLQPETFLERVSGEPVIKEEDFDE